MTVLGRRNKGSVFIIQIHRQLGVSFITQVWSRQCLLYNAVPFTAVWCRGLWTISLSLVLFYFILYLFYLYSWYIRIYLICIQAFL